MDSGATTSWWSTDEYADQLRAWVEDVLGPVRMIRRKQRAWATVWRVEAAAGRYWAKQNCPSQAFEGPLTALLAALVPGRVLEPTALRDDGTLLLPDGGSVLREVDGGSRDVSAWSRVVREWARLQRDLAEHADALVAVGVPPLPPQEIPVRVRERAQLLHSLDPADPRHLDDREWRALLSSDGAIVESAAAVAEVGLSLALNHNDLHDGNAFATADGEPLRFFDLADAVLTDPMAVLLVPFGQLPDDPRLRGTVARAWVEVWREVVDEAALWRVLPDALRLAAFCRHEAWWRVMTAMAGDELAEWGVAAPYWLAKVAEPPVDVVALV